MKATATAIVIGALVLGGALIYGNRGSSAADAPADNVTLADGAQVVEITARGGYQPRKSAAQAGVPTTLRFVTDGTFDCSLAVRIPSKGVSRVLPSSGTTDIDLGSNPPGTLRGTCGMGMYSFEIAFK